MRWRSEASARPTRNRSCPPRAAFRRTSIGWRRPSLLGMEPRTAYRKRPRGRLERCSVGIPTRLAGARRVRACENGGDYEGGHARAEPARRQRVKRSPSGTAPARPTRSPRPRGAARSASARQAPRRRAVTRARALRAPRSGRDRRRRRRGRAPRAHGRLRRALGLFPARRPPRDGRDLDGGGRRSPPGACSPSRATSSASPRRPSAAGAALGAASGAIGVRLANRLHRLVASRRRYARLGAARAPRSPRRRRARRRRGAPHGLVGARRAAGRLVARALPQERLLRDRLLPRGGVRLPARRRHRRAHLGRGRGRHAPRSVPARRARPVPEHDAARDRPSVPHAPAPRRSRGAAAPSSRSRPATSSRSWAGCRVASIPTAPSESGREQPRRRALRSGTRVPVMVKRVLAPDLDLVARATPAAQGTAHRVAGRAARPKVLSGHNEVDRHGAGATIGGYPLASGLHIPRLRLSPPGESTEGLPP